MEYYFAFLLVFFAAKVSFAQTTPISQQPTSLQLQQPKSLAPNTDTNVANNLHNWTQGLMIEVTSALVCQIVGLDPINPGQKCLGVDKQTGKIGYQQNSGGAIGLIGSLMATVYTPPVHVDNYFAYLSQDFGVIKSSYAQANTANSIGWQGLQPVLNIWIAFRNVAYFLFIIIFIIVGLAIMLRVKIDPRTVMTIQNQIPKLIIGIILVTFSFAIAGFLIDIMWVITYLAISVINPNNLGNIAGYLTQSAPGFANYVFGGPAGGGLLGVMINGAGAIGGFIQPLFNSQQILPPTGGSECSDIFCSLGQFFTGAISNILGVFLSFVMGWVAGIIAFLIIAIAMVVQLIKLWFKLLVCYITIIIDVILAPIWIIAGLVPGIGQSMGVGAWLRDLLANLMVFPAVVALFLLGNVIYFSYGQGAGFNPPLVGNFTGSSGGGIGSIIALGIILMSPNIVDAVKKAFKSSGVAGMGLGGFAAGAAAAGVFYGPIGRRFIHRDPVTQQLVGPAPIL